jgi:hypothetical protein
MKNILSAFLLMPLLSIAQGIEIDSFCGVRFGAAKENAIATLKSSGALVNSIDEVEELVYLSDLKFEGITSQAAYLKFVDNKLYEGIIEFDVNEYDFTRNFNRLKAGLSLKYGYGKDYSWFEPPYVKGDGNEFEAIENRKAKYCHVWAKSREVTANDFVVLELGVDKKLRVVFQNHAFAKLASQKFRQLGAKN